MMFNFRLQRVLELREKHEQAKAILLAKAEVSATAARDERDQLLALHSASRAEISSAHESGPTVGHLHHLGFVLNALDHRLVHASQTVSKAEGVVSEARVSLEGAARDRRVLDRLKEKHSDVHRAGEAHRDRVEMDEIALTLFTRQRQSERNGTESSAPDKAQNVTSFPGGATEV
ncbi:MAG: flagellar export protein FliJ [Gemmatimonadaceae bacterium]